MDAFLGRHNRMRSSADYERNGVIEMWEGTLICVTVPRSAIVHLAKRSPYVGNVVAWLLQENGKHTHQMVVGSPLDLAATCIVFDNKADRTAAIDVGRCGETEERTEGMNGIGHAHGKLQDSLLQPRPHIINPPA